jgi:hydroxyethylthiazole kinase-like uncharacterized protein yjeF
MDELLLPSEMAEADRLTIASGVAGITLMERAGRAVADVVGRRFELGVRVLILCGPGNNGGDGFVAARVLRERGYRVAVALMGDQGQLKGDAAWARGTWKGDVAGLHATSVDRLLGEADVVVDALFGAGLARDLTGVAAEVIDRVNGAGRPVIAVDLPSGVDGATGAVRGTAIRAVETVTFFRRKPGHLLLPGRALAGVVRLADIGIKERVLEEIQPACRINGPALWQDRLKRPKIDGHKYARGHCVVVSGPMIRTGAARLAAMAALRAGAGLVTVASPPDALQINAMHLTAVMIRRMEGDDGLAEILADTRLNAVVIGPAAGIGEATRQLVEAALRGPRGVVIDADGLTSFADGSERLFHAIGAEARPVILTPHEGEFARLFPDLAEGRSSHSKLDRARAAAQRSGAVIILKGADTVIAGADGVATIADNGPADLATAGSGDVLAGIAGAMLARGLKAFEAASAAVWIHGEAGKRAGVGLIAEDLPDAIRPVLADLAAEEVRRERMAAEVTSNGIGRDETD